MKSRREFLQNIAAAAMVLPSLPKNVSAGSNNFYHKPYDGPVMKVALMGLGSYANRVANAMKDCKMARITGLISGTPSKIADWSKRYNVDGKNCYNYQNFDAIENNPDIDIVYVITPNALHHDQVIRVANAGKHVICEKPMAINAKDGQEMVEACKKANVQLFVGYRMHFEPKTLEIIRQRNAGDFGKILFFQGLCGFIIGDPGQWRMNKQLSGGGSMMDIGIYAVNGSRYMIGEDPLWVTAQETKTDPVKFKEGIDETIEFQFGFPGGAMASCLSTYSMNNLDRFFLNGDNGFAELYPSTGYGPIQGRTSKGELNQPHVTHQTVQMDRIAGILLNGEKPPIPIDGKEAVKDLKIIDAIYLACKTGQKVELKF